MRESGGIIIPDSAKDKPLQGEIIAVGSGHRSEDGKVTPLDVKAGDKVLAFFSANGPAQKLKSDLKSSWS